MRVPPPSPPQLLKTAFPSIAHFLANFQNQPESLTFKKHIVRPTNNEVTS
ncbi:hypothetical protein CIB84_004248 [Bambusicola thoracicus]|uniref:Uncharacterized protein n=1 Tax=Bambusicola thoracicus TaxID=9083 RepID=A0A2P4T6N2_BAMTH|nr:hypothetical protein CIB84_004248 [Bambusicola thoracicus]